MRRAAAAVAAAPLLRRRAVLALKGPPLASHFSCSSTWNSPSTALALARPQLPAAALGAGLRRRLAPGAGAPLALARRPFSASPAPPTPPPPPHYSHAAPAPHAPRHSAPRSPLPPLARWPGLIASGSARLVVVTAKGLWWVSKWLSQSAYTSIFHPDRARAYARGLWADIKHELHHYWVGSKLLVAELRTSSGLVRKVGRGEQLTRRERLQLRRSMSDLLRMVPFIIIVIVPFAEFGLPVLLRFFPNLLPSQFEKPEFRQQTLRDSLAARIELQGLLQETLADMAQQASPAQANSADAGAASLVQQLDAMRAGQAQLPPEAVVRVAALFKDEPSLDSMPHWQLAALARYVGLSPYGTDNMLRAQLKTRFKELKADDEDLAREGTAGLSRAELKDACEARGMRAVGLKEEEYRRQLDEWLDLAIKKHVPATLLVLSRAFQISAGPAASETGQAQPAPLATAASAEEGLQQTISSLDKAVVADAMLAAQQAQQSAQGAHAHAQAHSHVSTGAAGTGAGLSGAAVAQAKLDLLQQQALLIKAEAGAVKAEAEARASAEAASVLEAKGLAAEAAKAEASAKTVVARFLRMRASDAAAAAAVVRPPTEAALADKAAEHALAAAPATLKALGQSFKRERALLSRLREVQQQRVALAAAAPPAGAVDAFLQSQVAKMGEQLSQRVEDASLTNQLAKADADSDGSVTRMQLIEALKSSSAGGDKEVMAAAAALIERLDSEREGGVAINDVETFLDKLAARAEAQAPHAKT